MFNEDDQDVLGDLAAADVAQHDRDIRSEAESVPNVFNAVRIEVQGARYPDHLQRLIDR